MVLKILDHELGESALEAVAATLGHIEALDIRTVPTLLLTCDSELLNQFVRPMIEHSGRAEPLEHLNENGIVLAMPFISGVTLRKAGHVYARASSKTRKAWYRAMGRFCGFDFLVDNTDRFLRGVNMSNIMVSEAGDLIGIDQTVGRNILQPDRLPKREIVRYARRIEAPSDRKQLATELFEKINRELSSYSFVSQDAFVESFEKGLLESMAAISSLEPRDLQAAIATAPEQVGKAADLLHETCLQDVLETYRRIASRNRS